MRIITSIFWRQRIKEFFRMVHGPQATAMRFAIAKQISQPCIVAEQINHRDRLKQVVSQIKQVVITIQNSFEVSLVSKNESTTRNTNPNQDRLRQVVITNQNVVAFSENNIFDAKPNPFVCSQILLLSFCTHT